VNVNNETLLRHFTSLTEFHIIQLPETIVLTEDLRMIYERIYNGKYNKFLYEKEGEIFVSVTEMHSKKQRNDGNSNKGSNPSLLSTSINVGNNHEQADDYESASDSFEEDEVFESGLNDHEETDEIDDFVMPIQPKRKKPKLENSMVLDAVHNISENSSTGQLLKSPGIGFQKKVSMKKSDVYTNENSKFIPASSTENIDEQANNHEQNHCQVDYYESVFDSSEEDDDCDGYKAEDDNCNKDNNDHEESDKIDDFIMPIQLKWKNPELENSMVLDAVNENSSSNYTDTELHKAEQPLKSPGFEFQEKQVPERKSKRHKVSNKKSEIALSSKASSSDIYTNENSEFISTSSTENIEQVEIDDITKIEEQLKEEPRTEWIVGSINITQKFRQYQLSAIDKAKKGLLKWDNTYEILALASIIVISSPSSLYEAAKECVFSSSIYINAKEPFLSKCARRIFNDLHDVPVKAPSKISEKLHCCNYLYPFMKPLFMITKVYEVMLNRLVSGSRKWPDFSYVVDNIPILNSEIKPLGFTPLQNKKDFLKVNLRAKNSINQQLRLKGGPNKSVKVN
ncbi:77_t:CDS:10, partial [Gigaspora rosea]